MQVIGAYLVVVLVWSTTPLAIHFSNSSLSFAAAVAIRMVLALLSCYGLLCLTKTPLVTARRDWLIFLISALGLFPNMLLVYWAAQYVASGLMSVIMGFYPFCVGLFSWLILRDNPFTPSKIVALFMALVGLGIIHLQQLAVQPNAALGIITLLAMCMGWACSSVLLKKLGQHMPPLRLGTGTLLVATPAFVLSWWILDGTWPSDVGYKSIFGVGYLVVAGSVIGHTLYFYVLRWCTVSAVSLITLITPVLAIIWGIVLADEWPSAITLVGAGLILVSLGVYQRLGPKVWRQIPAGRRWLSRVMARSAGSGV